MLSYIENVENVCEERSHFYMNSHLKEGLGVEFVGELIQEGALI